MNERVRENFKRVLHCFPIALIFLLLGYVGCIAVHYKMIYDDFTFHSTVLDRGVIGASWFFFKNANGRMAAHLFLCSVFRIFQDKENLFFIYHFSMLACFVLAMAYGLKNYLELFRNKFIAFKRALFYSAFITAFLFFFFVSGRFELWFWVSATGVYLISLTVAFVAFGWVMRKKQNAFTVILSLLIFFLAGGFSESFAVMYLLILSVLFIFSLKKNHFLKTHAAAIGAGMVGLLVALFINVLSIGIQNRLDCLPSFHLSQALLNTIHSLAFPILRYKQLPIQLVLIALLLLYAHFHFPKNNNAPKNFMQQGSIVLLFISISFFIPCYLLSDIVPERAASFGYLIGVLFLFDHFIFRSERFGEKQKEPFGKEQLS